MFVLLLSLLVSGRTSGTSRSRDAVGAPTAPRRAPRRADGARRAAQPLPHQHAIAAQRDRSLVAPTNTRKDYFSGFRATMSHMGVNAPVSPPSAQPIPPAWSMTWVFDVPAGTSLMTSRKVKMRGMRKNMTGLN